MVALGVSYVPQGMNGKLNCSWWLLSTYSWLKSVYSLLSSLFIADILKPTSVRFTELLIKSTFLLLVLSACVSQQRQFLEGSFEPNRNKLIQSLISIIV